MATLVSQEAIPDIGFPVDGGLDVTILVNVDSQVQEVDSPVLKISLNSELDVFVKRIEEGDKFIQVLLGSSKQHKNVIIHRVNKKESLQAIELGGQYEYQIQSDTFVSVKLSNTQGNFMI